MATLEHKMTIHGQAVQSHGASPSAVGALLTLIENSLHGAVEVAFRKSSGSGRRQPWLRSAGQVEFRDAEKSGKEEMTLHFEAPQLGEVAHEYYEQPRLFDGDGPSASDTAFDVFADVVSDVLSRKADSERYDFGLLRRFERYRSSVFEKNVSEVIISGHRIPKTNPCILAESFPDAAKALYLQTPQSMRVRIAGRLDMVQASTFAFQLLLPDGRKVRGAWNGDDFETLRSLIDKDVVASGMAIYRPSGSLLRIDADRLISKGAGDDFFSEIPVPTGEKLDINSLLRRQRIRGGVAAMWGMLPAGESDEEFLDAIANMD